MMQNKLLPRVRACIEYLSEGSPMGLLIEQCCMCGQIHRFGELRPVAVEHYHWGDPDTEFCASIRLSPKDEPVLVPIHRTVCARHVGGHTWHIQWKQARERLDPKYAVEGSLNAPLRFTDLSEVRPETLEQWYRSQCVTYRSPLALNRTVGSLRKEGKL